MIKGIDYVAYVRVSTQRQADSGLSFEAQEAEIRAAVEAKGGRVVAVFRETESGKKDRRPKLGEALAHAKRINATLIVSKLDRLSRSVGFLFKLRDSKVPFEALNMPGELDTLKLGILATVAQHEREMIVSRIKSALKAKADRGETWVRDGYFTDEARINAPVAAAVANRFDADEFAESMRGQFRKLKGMSAREAAKVLNADGVGARRGGQWSATQVIRLRERLAV